LTDRRPLPFQQWPEAHQLAWRTAIEAPDTWLGAPRIASWAPRTRKRAAEGYGRLLQWLHDNGLLEPGPPTKQQFRAEAIAEYVLSEHSSVKWVTLSTQLFDVVGALEAMMPMEDWSELRELRARIKCLAQEEPPQQPRIVHASQTLELGFSLMRRSLACGLEDDAAVDLYIDGLLIATLTLIYLRVGNFAALELDRHLKRGQRLWLLTVPGEETKNRHDDTGTLPDFLTPWLDYYVGGIRATLAARSGQHPDLLRLWIDTKGCPLSDQTIRKRIKRRTMEAFGFAIRPHAFRKIALTTFLIERPEYAAWGPALLRHHSPKTAEKHYFVAQRQLAVETYQKVLRSRRKLSGGDALAQTQDALAKQVQLFVLSSGPGAAPRSVRRRERRSTGAPRRRRTRLGGS